MVDKPKVGLKKKKLSQKYYDGKYFPYRLKVYMVWWEYVQILDDKKGVYKEWKIKKGQKWKDWWDKNGVRLFYDPIGHSPVKRISSPKEMKKNPDTIYLEVPINKISKVLVKECKDIIDQEFKDRGLQKSGSIKSKGKWVPEISSQFNLDVCLTNLKMVKLEKQGVSKKDIGRKMKINIFKVQKEEEENKIKGLKRKDYSDFYNQQRIVRRHITNGLKTLEWVKKGKFK